MSSKFVDNNSDSYTINFSLIKNLNNPNLQTRRNALNDIKKIWDSLQSNNLEVKNKWIKSLRPILWEAIENEKNEQMQNDLVKFSINSLKEKSLRKLIRFAEKNQLNNSSLKIFAMGFIKYSDDETNIALIKSIKRDDSSNIILFIKILLRTFNIYSKSHINNFSKIKNLINLLFETDTSYNEKLEFAKTITKRKDSIFVYMVQNYGNLLSVRKGVLIALNELNKDCLHLQNLSNATNNYKCDGFLFFGNNWPEIKDKYIIQSLKFRDNDIRNLAIQLLFPKKCNKYNFILNNDSLDLCEKIFNKQLAEPLIFDKNARSSINEIELVNKINSLDFELLINILKHLLPRYFLIKLMRDDPNLDNRLLSYKKLNHINYWLCINETEHDPHKSALFLATFEELKYIISQIKQTLLFEENKSIKLQANGLLFNILNLINNSDNYSEISLQSIYDNIDINSNQSNPYINSFNIIISSFINSKFTEFELITPYIFDDKTIKTIIHKILINLNNKKNYFSFESILDSNNESFILMLLEQLNNIIDNVKYDINLNLVKQLLVNYKDNYNIKIKGKILLILKKISNSNSK